MTREEFTARFPKLAEVGGTDRWELNHEWFREVIESRWPWFELLERDLTTLEGLAGSAKLIQCYRDALSDRAQIFQVLYEIHAAAFLGSQATQIDLHVPKGDGSNRNFDIRVVVSGVPINAECKTRTDNFPFGGQPNDEGIYTGTRATIDPHVAEDRGLQFDSQGEEIPHADIPESTVIRERLLNAVVQLPEAGCNLIIWGDIDGHRENLEDALYGTEVIGANRNQANPAAPFVRYRLPTGAFSLGNAGAHFRILSAVLRVQLRRNGDSIQKRYQLYCNPNAVVAIPREVLGNVQTIT